MPLYEFVCPACNALFEEILPADSPAPVCPQCGSKSVDRQISAPSPLKKGAFPCPPTGRVHSLPVPGRSCGACGSN